MQKTKLIDFLRTFDKAELKRFGDFVASPFFNKNERLVVLFHHIKKYHPEYDTHMLQKERVFKKLFPKTEMTSNAQNKLVHGLSKLAEEFLTQLKFEEKKRMKDVVHLESFERKGLEGFFFKEAINKINVFNHQGSIDIDSCHLLSKLNKLLYFQSKYNKVSDSENAFMFYNLYLTWYYMGSMYYTSLISKNFERTINKKIVLPFSNSIINKKIPFVGQAPQSLIKIKKFAELFVRELSFENYSKLKELICSNEKIYGNETKGLYVLLINYCVLLRHKINMPSLYKEKLNLYKLALKKKILSIPHDIDLINFTNIVKLACKVKDYEWLEDEVVNSLKSQNISEKESLIKYIEITLKFVKGEYHQVLSKLKENDIDNIVASLRHDLYIIRLKVYFYLELTDEFLASLVAYEKYIRRHKYYSPEIIKAGINMAKYFSMLYSIPSFEPDRLEHIKNKVENEEYVLNRNWILSMLDKH